MTRKPVTARVYPFDDDGFFSPVAETAYQVAKEFGLKRLDFQLILRTYAEAEDRSIQEYEKFVEQCRRESEGGGR